LIIPQPGIEPTTTG